MLLPVGFAFQAEGFRVNQCMLQGLFGTARRMGKKICSQGKKHQGVRKEGTLGSRLVRLEQGWPTASLGRPSQAPKPGWAPPSVIDLAIDCSAHRSTKFSSLAPASPLAPQFSGGARPHWSTFSSSSSSRPSKYYAVCKGKKTGVFTSWDEVKGLVLFLRHFK